MKKWTVLSLILFVLSSGHSITDLAVSTGDDVNIRIFDSTFDFRPSLLESTNFKKYPVLASLKKGEKIQVQDSRGKWIEVYYSNKITNGIGWVYSDYLLLEGILASGLFSNGIQLIAPGKLVKYHWNRFDDIEFAIDGKKIHWKGNLKCFSDPVLLPPSPRYLVPWISSKYVDQKVWPTDPVSRNAFVLISNVLSLYEDKLDSEQKEIMEFLFIKYHQMTRNEKESPDKTINLMEKFISNYPNGILIEEAKLLIMEMQNYRYEDEGYAVGIISEINSYSKYLEQNPESKLKEEYNFRIARLYRKASECDHDEYSKPMTKEKRLVFRQKAIGYYQRILDTGSWLERQKAALELYSIEKRRRIYLNSNHF